MNIQSVYGTSYHPKPPAVRNVVYNVALPSMFFFSIIAEPQICAYIAVKGCQAPC